MRRIKTISLTIPCVTGPYTNVSATLTLQSNRIRKKTTMSTKTSEYQWDGDFEDDRFNYNLGGIQSIATSSCQNDSGLFELNFRDERYLPFEGAGVISEWQLELPKELRQFDYNTISDVVIHMRYTAREGGAILKNKVVEALQNALEEMALGENGKERTGLFQVFSAKHEFPSEWHQFLYPSKDEPTQILELDLQQKNFPFLFRNKTISITSIEIYLKLQEGVKDSDGKIITYGETDQLYCTLKNPKGDRPYYPNPQNLEEDRQDLLFQITSSPINKLPYAYKPFINNNHNTGKWTLTIPGLKDIKENEKSEIPKHLCKEESSLLNPKVIEDIFIVCHYKVSK